MKRVAASLATDFKTTFLSPEKDREKIWRKLFIENKPHSDMLKRLLAINTPDCLDETNPEYRKRVEEASLGYLRSEGYLRTTPVIREEQFSEAKNYVVLSFGNYTRSGNPEFRDCIVTFTIVCHLDSWELENYQLRPEKIMGYIDGILNETKLSGIGTLQFLGSADFCVNEYFSGMVLQYTATHGSDDYVEAEE